MAKYESYESADSKFTPSVTSPDGQIKSYDLLTEVYYPNITLYTDKKTTFLNAIKVLTSNLEKLKYLNNDDREGYYYVYFEMKQGRTCLGRIHSDKLRSLLTSELYAKFDKYMMLSPDEKVEGEMMLALCTLPNL